MKNSIIIKCSVFTLLLTGWISCGQSKDDPVELEEEADDGIKIENLETRLRIVEPKLISAADVEYYWRASPKDIITNYPPYHGYEEHTYFGYTGADGETVICGVTNFPDFDRSWNGEFVHTSSMGTIMEVNVQLSGTVRLYTNDGGEKCGTFELTSLEPTGPKSDKPVLQPGVYLETYPYPERSKFNFMDNETVKIEAFTTLMYKYEIREDEYAIVLNNMDFEGYTSKLFFRVMDNSKFEVIDLYPSFAEKTGSIIMTFEREK